MLSDAMDCISSTILPTWIVNTFVSMCKSVRVHTLKLQFLAFSTSYNVMWHEYPAICRKKSISVFFFQGLSRFREWHREEECWRMFLNVYMRVISEKGAISALKWFILKIHLTIGKRSKFIWGKKDQNSESYKNCSWIILKTFNCITKNKTKNHLFPFSLNPRKKGLKVWKGRLKPTVRKIVKCNILRKLKERLLNSELKIYNTLTLFKLFKGKLEHGVSLQES